MNDIIIKSIKDVKLNDFVKFSDKDKRGKFSYVGQVTEIKDGWIIINTFQGIMGFQICKENELQLSSEPTGWSKFIKNPEKFREDMKEKEKQKDVAPEIKTQKQIIMEIVKDNKKLNKNKLLKLLKDKFPATDEKTLSAQLDLVLLKI